MQLRFGSAMSFDNQLIAARCVGRAWSLGEDHSQNERLWNGSCWRIADNDQPATQLIPKLISSTALLTETAYYPYWSGTPAIPIASQSRCRLRKNLGLSLAALRRKRRVVKLGSSASPACAAARA